MEKYEDEISKIKLLFLKLNLEESEIKSLVRRLFEINIELINENSFLKKQIIKADEDSAYLAKKADEWMLKAIEISETKQ